MFIIANIVDLLVNPFIWASILNLLQTSFNRGINRNDFDLLIVYLLCSVLLSIFFWSLHGPARVIEMSNAFKARRNYRERLLSGVMSMPLSWHSDHHSGDTIDKIEKGTTALFRFSEDSFEIIYAIIQFIGSLSMLVYLYPKSFPIALVMFGISIIITIKFDKILIDQYRSINKSENEISQSVFDSISNITTIIILRVEKLVFDSISHKIEKPYKLFHRSNKLNEFKWFLTSFCCRIMIVSVLLVYFWEHIGLKEGIQVGSAYLLFDYLNKVRDIFFRFTGMYSDVVKQSAKIGNSEILSEQFTEGTLTNHLLNKDWREINIGNLNFSYNNGENDRHLSNVNLALRRGERIAFIGETGSGKTTMLKVMRGLYDPTSLNLFVDGKNIPGGFDDISRDISLIPQDPEIFATTIGLNITLGAEYPPVEIISFCHLACFSEVLDKLPNGLDSSINEKGVNLSGGQKQRLALTRGLLASRDKSIILLDEPTSSLDPKTELDVYKNIMSFFDKQLIISTVHKLNLLPLFSRIVVFSDGQIIADGTISELLNSCPKFIDLWSKYQGNLQN
jgi:ABC-type multidrug transport system fused ATPase/permease subunit